MLAQTALEFSPDGLRLMGADEEGTLEPLKALRRELLDPKNRAAARDHD